MATSVTSDREKTGHLVLDAGAFISGCRVWEYAAKLYAVPEINKEVRDLKARQLLSSGIFELELLEPSRDAFRKVVAFARATGDYAALSAVDLKVLALTLQLELEQNGERFIREVPQRPSFSDTAPKIHNSLPKAKNKGKKRGRGRGRGGKGKAKAKEGSDEKIAENELRKSSETEETEAEKTQTEKTETDKIDTDKMERTETQRATENEKETAVNIEDTEVNADNTSVEEMESREESERDSKNVVDEKNASEEIRGEEIFTAAAEEAERDAKGNERALSVAHSGIEHDQEEEEEEEDEGEWVTPENFAAVVLGNASDIEAISDEELQRVHVACLTTDFAMQNVLLQMGLRVTSVDGLRIRRTKTWILRCIACFKVVQDRERLFCPHCGHDSLRKISVSVDESGTVQYYSAQKKVSIRGTRFSLPKPKPGRVYQATQPILCEDQLLKRGNRRKKERKVDPFDPEFVFASKQRNQTAGVGVGRRGNPNESRRRGKGKKK